MRWLKTIFLLLIALAVARPVESNLYDDLVKFRSTDGPASEGDLATESGTGVEVEPVTVETVAPEGTPFDGWNGTTTEEGEPANTTITTTPKPLTATTTTTTTNTTTTKPIPPIPLTLPPTDPPTTTTTTITTTPKPTTTTPTTTTTTTTTAAPTTTEQSTTPITAGTDAMKNTDAVVYAIAGSIVFLIILLIIILVAMRFLRKKKEGEKPKKGMGKSRTPSTRNTTDTSQQTGRPLLSTSNESHRPGTPGVVSANVHTDVTPGTGGTTTPSQQPLMRDLNETPGGVPPSQDVFIPGEQPYKIPAKHFKWCGPLRRKSRWHGAPDHDFEGVEGVKKVDRIVFDPSACTATEIGQSEIIEDAGPASDSNRSEFLNNLDEWEKNHKIYMAQKAAEKEGKANGNKPEEGGGGGGTPDSKKETKPPTS